MKCSSYKKKKMDHWMTHLFLFFVANAADYSAQGAPAFSAQQAESFAQQESSTTSSTISASTVLSAVSAFSAVLLPQEAKDTATTAAKTKANFFIFFNF
jgi:hypothetical protein